MSIYFIIGIILITYTTIKQVPKHENPVEAMFSQPAWWAASIVCVIFWPVLVAWAVYDLVKEIKEGDLV